MHVYCVCTLLNYLNGMYMYLQMYMYMYMYNVHCIILYNYTYAVYLYYNVIHSLFSQQSVDLKSHELDEVKDSAQLEKRKTHDMLSTLFREVNEASSLLGSKSEERLRTVDSSSEVSEEDFTRARIHLSNLRCEARTLKEQRDLLEGAEREARERAQTIMKELSSCRLKISQVCV